MLVFGVGALAVFTLVENPADACWVTTKFSWRGDEKRTKAEVEARVPLLWVLALPFVPPAAYEIGPYKWRGREAEMKLPTDRVLKRASRPYVVTRSRDVPAELRAHLSTFSVDEIRDVFC